MENLRLQLEKDLADSLEGEFKVAVELTSPAGDVQVYSKNNPSKFLGGQVLYFSRVENPETGEMIVVNSPIVTLRISSLNRVPQAGETWLIKMPISPVTNAPKKVFVFSPTKSTEDGTDMGFIRLYLQKIDDGGGQLS